MPVDELPQSPIAALSFEQHALDCVSGMLAVVENQELVKAMARLDALTNWESRPRATMRVGLEPMLDLAARLGEPQKSFRSIHVAGTKGKGSVSALIEAASARARLH